MTHEFATLTTDDLVTGEAVALDLPAASLGARIVSGLIDVVVTMTLFVAAIFVFVVAALQADGALIWASFIATMIVVFLVYPATLETLTRGQVARQAGLRPARGPRRRRADHLPARLRPGADRLRRDLRRSPACRRSSRR